MAIGAERYIGHRPCVPAQERPVFPGPVAKLPGLEPWFISWPRPNASPRAGEVILNRSDEGERNWGSAPFVFS